MSTIFFVIPFPIYALTHNHWIMSRQHWKYQQVFNSLDGSQDNRKYFWFTFTLKLVMTVTNSRFFSKKLEVKTSDQSNLEKNTSMAPCYLIWKLTHVTISWTIGWMNPTISIVALGLALGELVKIYWVLWGVLNIGSNLLRSL